MKKVKLIKTIAFSAPVIVTPLIANSCGRTADTNSTYLINSFAVKELNAALQQQFNSAAFQKVVSDARENNNAGGFSYLVDISSYIRDIYKSAIANASASTDQPKGFTSNVINNVKIIFGQTGNVAVKHSQDTPGSSGTWTLEAYPPFIASTYPKSSAALSYDMKIDNYSLGDQSINFSLRPGFRFYPSSVASLGTISQTSTGDNGSVVAFSSRTNFAVGIWNQAKQTYDYTVYTQPEGGNYWTACKVLNKNSVVFGSKSGELALGKYNSSENKFDFTYEALPDKNTVNTNIYQFTINKENSSEFFVSATYSGLYEYSVDDSGDFTMQNHFAISLFNNQAVTTAAGTVDNGKYLYVGTGRSTSFWRNGGVYTLNLQSPTDNAVKFSWSNEEGATTVNESERILSLNLDDNDNITIGFTAYNIGGGNIYTNRGILFGYHNSDGYTPSSFKWTYNTLGPKVTIASTYDIASFTYSDDTNKLVVVTGSLGGGGAKIFYTTINKTSETLGSMIEYGTTGTYNDLAQDGSNPTIYSIDFFKTRNNYFLYTASFDGLFISRTYNQT